MVIFHCYVSSPEGKRSSDHPKLCCLECREAIQHWADRIAGFEQDRWKRWKRWKRWTPLIQRQIRMGFGVWIRISSPSLKRNRWTRTALNLHCNDRICFNFVKSVELTRSVKVALKRPLLWLLVCGFVAKATRVSFGCCRSSNLQICWLRSHLAKCVATCYSAGLLGLSSTQVASSSRPVPLKCIETCLYLFSAVENIQVREHAEVQARHPIKAGQRVAWSWVWNAEPVKQ